MTTRRHFVSGIAASILAMATGLSWAAPPTVEIIAMAHPPVQSALKPLRDWLAVQGGKVKVSELDAESPAGEKRLAALGLSGHVPIVILVDGKTKYQKKSGETVSFVNFPSVKESPAGIRGDWLTEDVQSAVVARFGK